MFSFSLQKLCSTARANFGLIIITVNAFFINLPHFASFTIVYPDDDDNGNANITISKPKETFTQTEFGKGAGGMFYEFWIHCIILILIPWVSVLFMNVMIVRQVS